jgi:hypothetical protein
MLTHFAGGGGRPGGGENVFDPVLPADAIEQDLSGARSETTGEHFPIEFLSDVKPPGES